MAYDAVYYVECQVLFTVMLNVIMLIVVMLSVKVSEGENFRYFLEGERKKKWREWEGEQQDIGREWTIVRKREWD